MSNTLGEKIKIHRKQKELTLEQLAKKTGSSKSYMWELENRNSLNPSADKIAKIADVLSVTVNYLLEDNGKMGDDEIKEVFFRKFNKLESDDKKRIEDIIDQWGKK